ncbi:hypothetical protein U1Q18_010533 [Sarracenia purpurea var. burkii]
MSYQKKDSAKETTVKEGTTTKKRRGFFYALFSFGFLVYFEQSKRRLKSPGGEQDCASDEDSVVELDDLNDGQRIVVAGVAESVIEGTRCVVDQSGDQWRAREQREGAAVAFFLAVIFGDGATPAQQ